jgi:secondary thiamine-phosphate synthase enzyme
MPVHSAQLRVSTEGNGDIIDITRGVQEVVDTSGVRNGIVNVFVAHSTAAIGLIEYETGGVRDLKELMDVLVPPSDDYHHNTMQGDTNAHAHLQAAIVGPSETVPLKDGRLATGTWQQFVLLDFDDTARERTVMVQVLS